MAKKIRFPLEMKDGVKVYTMSELKENWDIGKIKSHFLDGRLATWLSDRTYIDISEKVATLENDKHLSQKLCEIFGMEYEASSNEVADTETLRDRNKRLNRLRQYTTDQAILDDIDHVAFDQDDLWDILLAGKAKRIYLVSGEFEIPLSQKNKEYVGIGNKAIAVIDSEDVVNFERREIQFKNIMFDEKYKAIVTTKREMSVYVDNPHGDYEPNGDLDYGFCLFYGTNGAGRNTDLAKKWFEKAADSGNEIAKDMLKKYENIERHSPPDVKMYGFDFFCAGEAVLRISDYRQAMKYFEKAAEKANTAKKF